jgi:hypothetical protein
LTILLFPGTSFPEVPPDSKAFRLLRLFTPFPSPWTSRPELSFKEPLADCYTIHPCFRKTP